MKLLALLLALTAGVCLFFGLSSRHGTIVALGAMDVEVVLFVTDRDSGEPIPGAMIDMHMQDNDRREWQRQKLATDKDGKARLFRKKNWFEDFERGGRITLTTFDLTWAFFSVTAKGYSPEKDMDLHTTPRKVTNSKMNPRFAELELSIPLVKAQKGVAP